VEYIKPIEDLVKKYGGVIYDTPLASEKSK
jgi:hypothetical protein